MNSKLWVPPIKPLSTVCLAAGSRVWSPPRGHFPGTATYYPNCGRLRENSFKPLATIFALFSQDLSPTPIAQGLLAVSYFLILQSAFLCIPFSRRFLIDVRS